MNGRISTIIGQRIKQAREEARLTQLELGHKLGFTDGVYVSKWETGKRNINTYNLEKLARVLGKPISYFFNDQSVEASHEIPSKITMLARELREELGKYEITASKETFVEVRMYVLVPEVCSLDGLLVQEPAGYVKVPKSQIDTVPPESYKDLFLLKLSTNIGEAWGTCEKDLLLILHDAPPMDGEPYLATYNDIMVIRKFWWEGKKVRMVDVEGISSTIEENKVKFSGRIILYGHWGKL